MNLSVSLNSRDFSPHSTFRFEAAPLMPSLSPGTGPTDGGTLVTLTMSAVRDVAELGCFFGGLLVAGSRVFYSSLLTDY